MNLATHLPVLLVVWPLAWGAALLLAGSSRHETPMGSDHPPAGLLRQRRLSVAGAAVTTLLALWLTANLGTTPVVSYPLGNWPPPFGIVLVADRLALLFVLLTAVVAWATLLFAVGSWDGRGRAFHPLFHLQWAGLNGAFLTGDIFNLFVFFEVLLIVSYALLTHGLGAERLRVGFGYVVVNLTASALFLLGLGLTYGAFGSLTLADLANRAQTLAPAQLALAQQGAALFLVVFAIKAAAVPLHFWLVPSYRAASPPVAALFAIMTKVGLYALLRVHWATWGGTHGTVTEPIYGWLLPLALLTLLLGTGGALTTRRLTPLVAYLTIASSGTVLTGIALGTPQAVAASLFYLVASTLTVALLFLLVAVVAIQRGAVTDEIRPSAALRDPVLLGTVMLLAAASAVGMPPLPGFLGKLLLLQASLTFDEKAVVWMVLLAGSALTLVALARAGVTIFWHHVPESPAPLSAGTPHGYRLPLLLLVGGIVAQFLFAEPGYRLLRAAAERAQAGEPYAEAVLAPARPYAPHVRPYDGMPSQGEER